MSSILASEKKRGRPRTGLSKPIGLRLYPEQSTAVDAWIAVQPDPQPTLTEAIRRLVDLGLAAGDLVVVKRVRTAADLPVLDNVSEDDG